MQYKGITLLIESIVLAELLLYTYWIDAPPNKTISKMIQRQRPLLSPISTNYTIERIVRNHRNKLKGSDISFRKRRTYGVLCFSVITLCPSSSSLFKASSSSSPWEKSVRYFLCKVYNDSK